MLVDTHAHLNFKAFDRDRNEIIKDCLDNDIYVVNVGSKYETSKKAVEIAGDFKGMYATVGLHPIHLETGMVNLKNDPEETGVLIKEESFDYNKYKELACLKNVVAIGETGLDYWYKPKTKTKLQAFKEKQREVLLQHIKLGRELHLPLVLHCRVANDDLISILKEEKGITGVIHCFTGTLNEAKEYLKSGFYLGFTGIIFKLDLNEVIREVPVNRILVETDCPYLTPPQVKEKRNEPKNVKYILEKIAELKKLDYKELSLKTLENAKKLFNLDI